MMDAPATCHAKLNHRRDADHVVNQHHGNDQDCSGQEQRDSLDFNRIAFDRKPKTDPDRRDKRDKHRQATDSGQRLGVNVPLQNRLRHKMQLFCQADERRQQ